MLLTVTSTSPPATDLGFLLHKNPASVRSVSMSWGTAHVFYPAAQADRCTAALLCEVDPVALVRRSRTGTFPLAAYVNDRPYAASSMLAVAIRKVLARPCGAPAPGVPTCPRPACSCRRTCRCCPAAAGKGCCGGCSSRSAMRSARAPLMRFALTR